jgi:hypothetical protein
MEITDKARRRLFKAHHAEFARVIALRGKMEEEFSDRYHEPIPRALLPEYPSYPEECRGMTCGGKGRRSGEPCKQRELYVNGRCKWHGGLSTGPKTKKGKKEPEKPKTPLEVIEARKS